MDRITKKLYVIKSRITNIYNVYVSKNYTLIPRDLVLVIQEIKTAFKINSENLCSTNDFVTQILTCACKWRIICLCVTKLINQNRPFSMYKSSHVSTYKPLTSSLT